MQKAAITSGTNDGNPSLTGKASTGKSFTCNQEAARGGGVEYKTGLATHETGRAKDAHEIGWALDEAFLSSPLHFQQNPRPNVGSCKTSILKAMGSLTMIKYHVCVCVCVCVTTLSWCS